MAWRLEPFPEIRTVMRVVSWSGMADKGSIETQMGKRDSFTMQSLRRNV